jgi:transporter family protein
MQNSWIFWAFLSALFAAATAILAKAGIRGVSSDLAAFLRTLVVVPALAIVLWLTGQFRDPAQLTPRNITFLVLSGLATGASWLAYFRALSLGQAAQVASVDKLSVVLVAILAVVFLGENLTLLNWFGIALVVGGTILAAWH